MKIKMGMETTYCGIVEFYHRVAEVLGYENTDNLNYACTKISVAENIADNIFAYMLEEQGFNEESRGMAWLCYGPKAIPSLEDDTVEIEDGFIKEVE